MDFTLISASASVSIYIYVARMRGDSVAAVMLFSILSVHAVNMPRDHREEWQLWKGEHGKSYESQREELERHLVWLSNREYINAHNKNAHSSGYTLHLNQFSDWVSHRRTCVENEWG